MEAQSGDLWMSRKRKGVCLSCLSKEILRGGNRANLPWALVQVRCVGEGRSGAPHRKCPVEAPLPSGAFLESNQVSGQMEALGVEGTPWG